MWWILTMDLADLGGIAVNELINHAKMKGFGLASLSGASSIKNKTNPFWTSAGSSDVFVLYFMGLPNQLQFYLQVLFNKIIFYVKKYNSK